MLRVEYVSAHDLSPELIDRHLEFMDRRKVRFLAGYAQSLDLFARRAVEVGYNHRLQAAVSWAAMLLPSYRRSVREGFGCRTFDTYGVGEGMQVAAQCGQGDDVYHLFCLGTVCEACRDGIPVPAGDHGDLLLTRLDPGVTPLIRYAVGDLGVLSNQDSCACGRNLPQMESVVGRASDIIHTPSGKQVICHFFSRLFSSTPTVRRFQIVQRKREAIRIKLEVLPGYTERDGEAIRDEIHDRIDPDLRIEIECVDEIELDDNAKYRYIVSVLESE